ncbi:uncharacterized protein LOC117108728 [Anneissia japonica]|uniref:uncharacterized protein LOC117108728 n=1 Tax=Anneissia japonica TaxID=1529436 RepID=UPI0014256926|nr:uncharacterized protein LOC117108728 [Anneissia japonica]
MSAEVDIEDNSCLLFTDSIHKATTIVEEYERQTCSRFISAACSKDFGKSAVALSIDAKKIYWNTSYNNEAGSTPYIIIGQKQLDCHHGKDPDKAKKAKYKAEKEKKDNPVSYLRVMPSKKVDCPAKITLRDVVYFTDFKIERDTKYHRQTKSRKLKTDFKSNKCGKIVRHILVNLPAINEHRNHPSGEEDGLTQRVDPNVSKKIDELLAEGINSVKEIQKHIESYVTTEQFPGQSIPTPSNRRYFPNKKTIRTKIYQFMIQKKKLSAIEQESNERISEEVVDNDLIACAEVEVDNALIACLEEVVDNDSGAPSEETDNNLRVHSEELDDDARAHSEEVDDDVRTHLEEVDDARARSEEVDDDTRARSEVVDTLEQATAIVKDYEERTLSKFISLSCPKDFGKSDAALNIEAKKIYWDNSYTKEETGSTPYIIVSQKQLECQYGKDRDEAKKAKLKAGKETKEDCVAHISGRGRPSKKVDCPAKLVIRDLVYFTDFKIKDDTKYRKERKSKELKVAFKNKQAVRISRHFFINLPSTKDHRNHEFGQIASPPTKRKQPRKKEQDISTAES